LSHRLRSRASSASRPAPRPRLHRARLPANPAALAPRPVVRLREPRAVSTKANTTAVVIPAYNAGRHLGAVLARVLAQMPREHVYVVDDGSQDDTAHVATASGVRVIRQTPNQGKAAALRTGFDATREYDRVATLDADGQHDPADLPRFFEAARTH